MHKVYPTEAAKAHGFTQYCDDCDGCKTTKIRAAGLWNNRAHACGCNDWSYTSEKGHPWWRLKWCDYHREERVRQIQTREKQVAA